MLVLVLQQKFHQVPIAYKQRIAEASPDMLQRWAKQILTSQAIEEVFGGNETMVSVS